MGGGPWSPDTNFPTHHTARLLAREHRVLYLCRDSHVSLLGRVAGRLPGFHSWRHLASRAMSRPTLQRVDTNLWVGALAGPAAALPLSYPPAIRRLNEVLVERQLRAAIRQLGFERPLLWFYWWFFPELVSQIPHSVAVYDMYDDHLEYDYIRHNTHRVTYTATLERRLLREVDVAFGVSRKLVETKASVRPVHYLPNGVDLTVAQRAASLPAPDELSALPRPIVGYLGGYDSRLSWELVEFLAGSRPQWTFLFVGGGYTGPSRTYPNLRLIGNRPYQEAMRYVNAFDVALIPFVIDALTEAICPAKLFDYLALGKPIVSTPLPAIDEVAGGASMVYRGSTPDTFLQMIEQALIEPHHLRDERRALAATLTWEARINRAMSLVLPAMDHSLEHATDDALAAAP